MPKSKLLQYFNQTIIRINEYAEKAGAPYVAWGIFATVTYPLYYLIWMLADKQGYENLTLRALTVIFAIPLIFKNKWPPKLIKYLPLYWYLHLLYSLPFLFSFLLLKNNFSSTWTLNVMTILVLSILLLDLAALAIILPLGILAGWLSFITTDKITVLPDNGLVLIITYFSIIVFGALFAHRKELIHNEKMQAMKSLSANIAHELRTPLRSISAGINGIRQYLPILLDAYITAKKAHVKIPSIGMKNFELLQMTCEGMESEVNSAFTTIDVLLTNVNHTALKNMQLEIYSIKDCLDEALRRYPFDSGENELLRIDDIKDFKFNGNKTAIIHVFFNLLKNALFYIRASIKSDARILIWTDDSKNYNYLHFKDTGSGIDKKILPHIFERFYSRTRHGSGIGLPFCKYVMELMDGEISCQSTLGEYTEFTLQFPKFY